MKLYEISVKYLEILNEANENGEIDQIKFEENHEAMEEKSIAVASFIKNLQAEYEAVQTARKEMQEREAKLVKKIKYLSGYLKTQMEFTGISKISSSPLFEIKIKNCPPSLDIINETMVPDEFWESHIVRSIDRISLKRAIQDGVDIEGAKVIQRTRLEIK